MEETEPVARLSPSLPEDFEATLLRHPVLARVRSRITLSYNPGFSVFDSCRCRYLRIVAEKWAPLSYAMIAHIGTHAVGIEAFRQGLEKMIVCHRGAA